MSTPTTQSSAVRVDFIIPEAVRVLATLTIFEDASGAVRQTMRVGAESGYTPAECISFFGQAVIDCISRRGEEREVGRQTSSCVGLIGKES